jgi:transcriptional antiterminator RfaH
MAFWTAARLQPHHEALALHTLGLAGYAVYLPRLREQKIRHDRKLEVHPPLFVGYCFVAIDLQWHNAHWAPGVLGLVLSGGLPARVPDNVIAELRGRERDGYVVLPKQPRLRRGEQVRVVRGAFEGQTALYTGMKPRQRVEVLLTLLGTLRRIELGQHDIEPVR